MSTLARRFGHLILAALFLWGGSCGTAMADSPVRGPTLAPKPTASQPPAPSVTGSSANRAAGFSPAGAPGAGPCPNAASYAYDPRTARCVRLRPCAGGMIWNPDRNACVPRPPGGVLECLGGEAFDTAKNACVAPNCGSLLFDPQKGQCVPPPPIVCAPGMKFDSSQNKCVAEAYDILQFVIGTGGDNLESNSAVWAVWNAPDGTAIFCTLHDGGDGWDNNSTHAVLCDLGAHPMTQAQLQATKISIAYNAGVNISLDNWNLQSVTIGASNPGEQRSVCVFSASGNPLHRFQLQQQGTFSDLSDPDLATLGAASDGVVVTDFPGRCP